MANIVSKKRVAVDFNPDELEQLDWLKTETKRGRTGVIKWLIDKEAKELGYVPKKAKR